MPSHSNHDFVKAFLGILEKYSRSNERSIQNFSALSNSKGFVRISHQKYIFTVNRRSFLHTVLMATRIAEVVVIVATTVVLLAQVHG
jgi:hypothetical protein